MKRQYLALPALALSAGLTFAACGGDQAEAPASSTQPGASATSASAQQSSSAPETSTTPSAEQTPSETPTPTPSAAATLEKLKATSPKITDPVLKSTAQVEGVAFGFVGQGEYAQPSRTTATWVVVKVSVTTSDKFYNGIDCSEFELSTPDTSTPQSDRSSLNKEKMAKEGMTKLERVSSGKKAQGWCLFAVENPTKDNLTLHFERGPLKDSKTKKTYEAMDEEMKIKVG